MAVSPMGFVARLSLLAVYSRRPLPSDATAFERLMSMYCPRRRDLRDLLPTGSLDTLGRLGSYFVFAGMGCG